MTYDDAIKIILDLPNQLKTGYKLGADVIARGQFNRVIVAGMGGSALPGDIVQTLVKIKVPFMVVKDYELPEVDSSCLVVAISYSGNTEETLSCCRQALRSGASIVGIASGAKLAEFCQRNNLPFIKIPEGFQPRYAYAYQTMALLRVLVNAGLVDDPAELVKLAAEAVGKDYTKQAKEIAEKISGKIPLIYTSTRLRALGYKWKIAFNENCKTHAFSNVFPELNHNELQGYSKLTGKFYVIILHDEDDHLRNRERMRITREFISRFGCESTEILIKGDNIFSKVFSTILMGDLTAVYLAGIYGINPDDSQIIESFKKGLGQWNS